MNGLENWLFPTSQVGEVIKFRPLSLEMFYSHGLDPWSGATQTMESFLGEKGVDTAAFLRGLEDLADPGPDTRWDFLPSHFLIDYLTKEHRSILYSDIPAIRYLMDMGLDEMTDGQTAIQRLSAEVARFMEGLRFHIGSEEDVIFPIILRNEFLLRRSGHVEDAMRDPMLFAGAMMIGRESDLRLEAAGLFEGYKPSLDEAGESGIVARLAKAISSLENRLRAHKRLESDTLYLMVERIESELRSWTEVSR
jgi:iron-sulfur cluster repair protein YtfE (RIC family)